jgi:cyclophilin family peptidyl-prolyl cis-trans isomerase/HEAT repeat protein
MSRDVELRRWAMRALARIADTTARSALERGLSDEDSDVVAWAAFGLGRACEQDSDAAVAQLAMRSATWSVANRSSPGDTRNSFDPMSSIARALGRCGTVKAEATLRGWLRLDSKLADQAAIALGSIAVKQHRLDNTTLVALLDAGDSKSLDVPSALFPFSRLTAVDPIVQKRLLTVATKSLGTKTAARQYAIRVLSLAGEAAIPTLERVLCDKAGYSSSERTDAVRSLARLGEAGQQALSRALARLLPRSLADNPDWFLSEEIGPIVELLEHLNTVEADFRPMLEAMGKLTLTRAGSPALERRVRWLRCQGAAILAGSATTLPLLVACDPEKNGHYGALALSRVLGKASIRGSRTPLFDRLAHSIDIVVRESALRLLQSHPEIRDAAHVLADALQSDVPGVVATAASVLVEHPERSQIQRRVVKSSERTLDSNDDRLGRTLRPTPEILLALGKAVHHAWEPDGIDVRTQLVDAVSALAALSEKSFIEEQCRSNSLVLRQHAESALRNLGDTKRHCAAGKPTARTAEASSPTQEVRLRFHTDVGPLDLWVEPQFAPLATERLLALVKSGFFTNMSAHRVVPGFVVQLGDRTGDGFSGAGLEVLPDELAPTPFQTNDVGMALSGPNTGSSQFFIVLGPHPHLDGEYTRVGRAGPGWNRLMAGDVIVRAEVVP